MPRLSEAELLTLRLAAASTLISQLDDKQSKGPFNEIVQPGAAVIRRMVAQGLVYITEEDPIDLGDGEAFAFTPSLELTDDGQRLAQELANGS